jgi:3-oxoacyl-[acyl-carrier-protein] synthase-3
MKFNNVCFESFGISLPDNPSQVVSSSKVEEWLTPLYQHLSIPLGKLEEMTGIQERKMWPKEMLPSEIATLAANAAFKESLFELLQLNHLLPRSARPSSSSLRPFSSCSHL